MEATLTPKQRPSIDPDTSILTDDNKTLFNIEESHSSNEVGLNQYINPGLYLNTNLLKTKNIVDTVKVNSEKESLEENISFFSSYTNPYKKLKGRFEIIQQWEGHIEELDDKLKVFRTRLIDLTSGGTDEYTEFPYDEVDQDDYDLMKEGAIFYYTIGKVQLSSGQIKKDSFLKFKRLPRITQADLDSFKKQADNLYSRFLERRNRP